MRTLCFALAAASLLCACAAPTYRGPSAAAQVQPTQGSNASAHVIFEQIGANRVRVSVVASGLRPSREHGFHVHENGDCSDNAMGAGGHFDPFGKPHGSPLSPQHHAGDLLALKPGGDGRVRTEFEVGFITVTPGPASVVNRAVVIHADPDDYKSQPAGNSGARIACGVVRAG